MSKSRGKQEPEVMSDVTIEGAKAEIISAVGTSIRGRYYGP